MSLIGYLDHTVCFWSKGLYDPCFISLAVLHTGYSTWGVSLSVLFILFDFITLLPCKTIFLWSSTEYDEYFSFIINWYQAIEILELDWVHCVNPSSLLVLYISWICLIFVELSWDSNLPLLNIGSQMWRKLLKFSLDKDSCLNFVNYGFVYKTRLFSLHRIMNSLEILGVL